MILNMYLEDKNEHLEVKIDRSLEIECILHLLML